MTKLTITRVISFFGKRFVRAPYGTFQRHISSINEKDDCVCDEGPFKYHSSPMLPAVL